MKKIIVSSQVSTLRFWEKDHNHHNCRQAHPATSLWIYNIAKLKLLFHPV